MKLDEDETSALANKAVVKLQRKFSEKVLTTAAEPWKPGNIQHGEEVKMEK